MAQKTPPTRAGSKKTKKPTDRKAAHASAKAAKTTSKRVAVSAQAKRPAKPTPARPQPHKPAAQTAAKAAAHKSALSKGALKEPTKPHAAPRQEASRPLAPTSKPAPLRKEAGRPPAMPPPLRPAAPGAARTMPAAVAKAASQKIIAPASSGHPAASASAPSAPGRVATAAAKKPVHQRHGFKVNEWIVYPAHGVGRIVAIEEQEIAGIALELFVITFEKDKMTLRVPTGKSEAVGMRKLAEEPTVKKAIETLKGRARVKRTMWSRRAQEYEAKINSGDLIAIAEVVRDLYRSENQPEQSYSERQLYEAALDRMAREIAVVEKLDERGAVQRITEVLAKSARGRGVAAAEAA
jgi:CarD family transcriptional regulator